MAKGQMRKSKEARKLKDPQSKKSAGPKYLRDAQVMQVGQPSGKGPRKPG
jgi:hypothetical protein